MGRTLPFSPNAGEKTVVVRSKKQQQDTLPKIEPLDATADSTPTNVGRRDSWKFERLSEEAPKMTTADEAAVAGRYIIEAQLGEGGMGAVYRVRHRQLGKSFALKLMLDEFSRDAYFRQLFHREAQLASLLQHPNIVSVVDFGDDPEQGLFMVMELVKGESLTDRINRMGRLPLNVVCDVTMQLADALRLSHSQHVVHADIKPDNVICLENGPRQDRRQWSVKLLDFGMANLVTSDQNRQEQVGGTPEYMAPERISGSPPLPSMDIYALGVMVYQMVTGTVPFASHTAVGVLQAQLHDRPKRMAEIIKERVPTRLEQLVDRALSKRPEDRHPNMDAFTEEVRALMEFLGLRDRRRGKARSKNLQGGMGIALRQRTAAAVFDDLPWPVATVLEDGTITLANPAFAYFLTGQAQDPVEGLNVLHSKLPRHHPTLEDDIRMAIHNGAVQSTVLDAKQENRLHLTVKQSRAEERTCMISIQPLPTE
jgi:PAS domain-containing protein